MEQSYTDLDEENFENNSEPWAHALDLCKTMSEHTCLEVCKFTKKKKKTKKKKGCLLYCFYIYTLKNMMLKVILVEQTT